MTHIAYIALTPNGAEIAQKLKSHFGGQIISKSGKLLEADIFVDNIKVKIAELFSQKTVIIGICSMAILTRSIAPKLQNKHDEPPVIAIDDKASHIIPLVGGHSQASTLGSGVDIALKCANILGAKAVITTAGDQHFGISLDTPPSGYTLTNP
ncbi:MAG: precorrin-3B C(17)-methyltransferase, partial [Rhizobiales bacterium]|nr:precorrin-3B C(17)-methyltransferase [Hyphomicrobiales bacterium]